MSTNPLIAPRVMPSGTNLHKRTRTFRPLSGRSFLVQHGCSHQKGVLPSSSFCNPVSVATAEGVAADYNDCMGRSSVALTFGASIKHPQTQMPSAYPEAICQGKMITLSVRRHPNGHANAQQWEAGEEALT